MFVVSLGEAKPFAVKMWGRFTNSDGANIYVLHAMDGLASGREALPTPAQLSGEKPRGLELEMIWLRWYSTAASVHNWLCGNILISAFGCATKYVVRYWNNMNRNSK